MNHSTKSASTTRVAYSLIGLLLLAQALLSVAPRETVGQENLSFSELAVRNIDPVEAKAQISRIMGDSVEVIADREGRRLLLRGVGDSIRISRNILEAIDKPNGPAGQTEKPARPSASKAFEIPTTQHTEVIRYLRSIYPADAGVLMTSNTNEGTLVVQAPEMALKEITSLLTNRGISMVKETTSDLGLSSKQDVTESFKLRFINYRELESVLVETWGDELAVQSLQQGKRVVVQVPVPGRLNAPVSLTIDRSANQLFLSGRMDYVTAWKQALAAMDAPAKKPTNVSSWLKVKDGKQTEIKQAISYLSLTSEEADSKLRVVGERTPAIGPNGQGLNAQVISNRTFQEETGGSDSPDAGEGGQGDDGAAQPPLGPVEFEFIEELGIVIVKGAPEDVIRVQGLIKEIEDLANQTQPEVRYYNLENVDSTAIATIAQELYDNIYQARQGTVTITALGKPNAVLLVGRKEAIEFVENLLKELDVPSEPDAEFKSFRLKYISSEDAKSRLNEFYLGLSSTGQGGGNGAIEQGNRPGLGTRLRVVSDYRSNTIIVQASPSDMGEIAKFIAEIDVIDSEAGNEVKIFRLKNALAEELQPVLQDALNGQLQGAGLGTNPGGQNTQQNQQFGIGQQQLARVRSAMLALRMINAEGKIVRGGIMFDVRVTADTNSNSLVVTGPSENMPLIGALINSLDQLPEVETKIKVFSVINNDAGVLLQLLTDMFSTGQTGGGQQNGVGNVPVFSGGLGEDSTLVGLRFSADPRTNSIIASGSEANLRVVEDLLYRLDQEDLHRRVVKVFRLRNTLSDNVVAAVQEWISQRATLYGDGGDAVGVPFSREIIVVSEPEGNSIIVSAAPEYFAEIKKIIEDLDRRPMFMIHCLIAQVELGSREEFGFQWGIQDSIVFNRGLGVTPPVVDGITSIDNPFNTAGVGSSSIPGLNENLAGMAVSSLGLGRNSSLGYGGLVMSAGNESVNMLLRALEAQNRLEILSSPTIMTMDNLQGFVQQGAIVRFIEGTTITNGVVQNNLTPVDTGIILQVRPRLSPDGLIVMEVDATNSSLGNEADGPPVGIQDGEQIRVPPINITTAQTTIMARHGQTTMFAGLIEKSTVEESRRVPILGDIPAIGRLFRYDLEDVTRKELLIVLTPYIVDDESDLQTINQVAMDRMNWCMSNVAEVHGPIGYDGETMMYPHQPEIIYPDLDPTGSYPDPAGSYPQINSLPAMPSPSDRPAEIESGDNQLGGPLVPGLELTEPPEAEILPAEDDAVSMRLPTSPYRTRVNPYTGRPSPPRTYSPSPTTPRMSAMGGTSYPTGGTLRTSQPNNYR